MAEEPVDFDRVTKLYREESQKKSLTPVEPDFWEKVTRYLTSLESELAAARAKDPNSKAAMLLQDELQKVLSKREQIYQYRERKLGLLAGQIAGGAKLEMRGLAKPEHELLGKLVALLTESRAAAFGGGARAAPPGNAAPATGPAPTAAPPPPAVAPPKGVIVHVLEDMPPFAGPDGTYRLRKEDIVVVPPTIAKVLTERGKARVVTPAP